MALLAEHIFLNYSYEKSTASIPPYNSVIYAWLY